MSKFNKLLIFLEGLVVGGIGGHLLTKYPILHSPSKILDREKSKKIVNDICDEQKSYEKEKAENFSDDPYGLKSAEDELVNKNRKYIEYKDEKKDENDVDPKNVSKEFDESSDRVSIDDDSLPSATYGPAFISKKDVEKIVEGKLHLVTEAEINGTDMEKRQTIKKIKELDFIKAIEMNSAFEMIAFNPKDKSFSYANTSEKIPYEEACRKFTKSIVEDILNESSYNADGWIQPLNLYDSETNFYIIIETKKD